MKNYEQIKVLGEGGFGKAILARQKSDNKRCAIKEVRLSSLSPKDRNEAQKEAKVLASLKHPNIVDYITSFQERGCFYIVMEFADGGDLSQKIEKRKHKLFSENEILHDFIQIALAIKYIHDRKILHRDLKTQNIFLMKDGQVKLGDFGIARVLEHTFQLCRTQIGTPYYLSPEICEGKNYNAKTDIWSLGCILYELCTLQHAFQGGNMQGLMMNICRGRFSPISSSYSADLKNLVTSMLTKDPLKRPSINTILTLPFIKSRLNSLLEKTILDYEFSHTILHGRKPFAAPTIVLSKNENLSIENNQNSNNNNNNDDNNNNQNGNINNNMNNGNNGYKSPARGNDSRNNRNPPPSQNNRQPSNRQPSNRQPARQQMPRNLPSGADPRYYRRQQAAAAAAAEPNADPRYNRQRQPNNNQNAEEQRKQYEEELKLAQEAEERRILEERKRKEIRDEEDKKRRERDDDERRIIEQRRQQINEERRKKMKEEEEKRMEQELERRRILEEKRKQAIAEAKKQKEIEEFKRIAKERERQKARQAEEERRKQIELEKQRKKEEMRKQWEREEEQRKQEEQRRLEEKKKADERRRQEYLERKKFEEQLEEKKKEERRQKMLEMEEERRQYEEFERQKREEEIQRKKELAEQQRKRREEEEEMKRREEEKRKQRVQEQLREREELEAERIKMAEEEKARKRAMIQKQRELREEQRRIEEEKRKRNIEELNQCDGIFGEKQPDIQYQPKQIYKGSPSRLNNNRGRESPNPNDDFLIGGDRPAWATPAQNKPPPPKQQRRRERPAWVSPSEDFSVLNQSPPKQTPSPNPVQKPKRQSRMPQSDGYDSSSSESYDRPIGRNNLNTRPAWVNNSEDYADALPKPQSPPQRQPRRSPQNRQPKPNQQKENHQRETPQENESDRFIDEHVAEEPSWAKMPPKRVSIEPLEQNEAQKESSAQSQNDKPKSFDEMSVEERNAYAKQLRHEAAANRKKAMQLEAKSSEDDVSNVNRQQPQKNQQVTREQQPKPQINLANKKFDDMTNEERNEYMRQLRHEAQANKQKANQRVVGSDLPEEPSSQPKSNPPPQSNIVNKKFDDMTNEERNEYMRQLRHEAQANKQKANQRVVGSDLPDESYSQQEQKPQRQEQPMQNLANKKFDDMTNEERNEYMRQLRHEAQANKQKANQRVVGADIPEEPSYQQQLQQPKPQSNLANKKFDDMTNEERNEYMRQLRHEAQANKQKANQRVVGSDLPDESYSQQEQKPQRQEQPMQNLANKKFDDMTNEERNEYMRQIRHEAQANKNRAKQLQVGPPADNAFENRNKAPNGKMVNPDFYKPNQQRNDSPSKVERIAKHEISEEDRRRIYEEQRAAFKSYRNRGRLLDNGADMKEAIEDSSYQPEPYKDERIAKHEISEEDRRKIYEEQRAAFKAYRNRGRLFDNGADMKEAIENPGYQPEPYKDERIAKHEISEADRRKIYEEQRAAFKSYRNRGRLLDNGSDMKEAIEDSSYQPEPYKDERIAKHEISEADRRRIYEEQRAAFKSYRNRGRLFDNGADMKEAIENPGYQPEPYKDERIAKHEISEADRRKIYEEQHAAFKKYKNRGRVVDSFVEDEPPSGNNYDNNNSKYNNDYQNNVYNQNDNDYNDYDNKNDRYDNNDNKNYDYNNNDNNNDDYYNDNNDDYYYNDDNDNNSYNDNNYNNDNYYNDEYKDDYNDNFNNNNNNNDDYNDNYNNDYKDDKDFEESIQEQLPQWARAPTKREKLPKQIHAAGSPRFYEEVGNDDDDNVDDEPISVSRQNTASNFVENRKAQNNRPQRKIQLDSDDEAYNTNEEENDIHLPESGKSTLDFDELKKSARIFNSPKEDILKNVDIDAPKELHKHAKKMAKLHDLAMSLKEALELPEKHNFEDDFEDFDDDQQLQKGRQKQQQQVFYIDDKEVVFPIASDKESMQFRIESMRNYLEKQIGLQKLIALNNELINKSKDDATPTPIISDLSPGLVCLAEQLLVIDTPNRP